MARRSTNQEGMNLDSLLDTLTNVVGVLVMVLMLTTLNVQSAIQRILDIDPTQITISEDDLQKVQQQAEETHQRREVLATKLISSSVGGPSEDFGALMQQIEKAKADQAAIKTPLLDNDALRKQFESESRRAQSLSEQVVNLEEQLARLKALLDKTESVAAPPPKIVKIPNPRAAPQNAVEYRVIVRDGRVLPFNPAVIRERCKKQVEVLLKSPLLREKNGDVDCEKLVETFNRRSSVADKDFNVRLAIQNFNLTIEFEMRSTSGETAREVGAANSNFRRGLRALENLHGDKFYIRFLVWSDSFETYVAGRRVCDEMNVPAGWEPYNANFIWREGLGMTVPCQGRPAPPPPPKSPPPPPPAGPPPPPLPNDIID